MAEMRELVLAIVMVAGVATLVACTGYDAEGLGCSSDDQCRGDRICVDQTCVAPLEQEGDAGSGDVNVPLDGVILPPNPPSDIGVDRPDGGDEPHDRDTVDDDSPVPPIVDAGGEDTSSPGRPLSCHEFATCQFLRCDTYDYSCRERYSARTSEQEIDKLDERQNCMQENCSGITDQDQRHACRNQHCSDSWRTCAGISANSPGLDCAGFHACLDLCNGSDSPASCRQDCTQRVSNTGATRIQQYQQCTVDNCEGRQGQSYLSCIRRNCKTEISQCWGC